jgi:hypothetical protein
MKDETTKQLLAAQEDFRQRQDHTTKKLLEAQEDFRQRTAMLGALRPQGTVLSEVVKSIENSGVRHLMDEVNRHQEAIRAALGPIKELHHSGMIDIAAPLKRAQQSIAAFEARFRLPEISEVARLWQQVENSSLAAASRRMQEQSTEILRAMESKRQPWLDIENSIRSIGGFAELQGIGLALKSFPSFDVRLADVLRADLGDWRLDIAWPTIIFTDPVARTAFYGERGLDPALTSFPAQAFQQSIAIAGLTGAPPPLLRAYQGEAAEKAPDAQADFARTNAAHDRLLRFETQLRCFIDQRMQSAFGVDWIKHRVPGEIRKAWLDKREKARAAGEKEWSLIAYADFTDYVPIITRRDNWEAVFKPIFRRSEFVFESFQRLYPIRICTMHARLITQDDELYLYVEIKRILTAIGVLS